MSALVIVSGTFRMAPDRIEDWRPHAIAMLKATRAEPGCRVYSYSQDAEDPGLIRVYEEWESRDALADHFSTPHMKTWRAALARIGTFDRDLRLFEASEGEPV
ncbi:quinol monooxygenase YgiN [Breoghania corrubedonensis]|uniref:Quinol monooxygenase YgiN n=1 Tax=Breoghania corrubedonensis TaxID=665038 RepID=A0A2T5VIE6_9HYPH|nr:putative quinol monooxygenase [Breoghania corrubedonensis]PTW63537.1 quinol monooxygenase YgiN [Breoghania corrubedonensis]